MQPVYSHSYAKLCARGLRGLERHDRSVRLWNAAGCALLTLGFLLVLWLAGALQ